MPGAGPPDRDDISGIGDADPMSLDTATIHQKAMLPASPEVIFDLLVDPDLIADLTGEPASGSREVGGTMISRGGRIIVRHLELERGKRIVQEWSTDDWPSGVPPSRLEIGMRAFGQGTDLRLVQTGVPPELADRIEQGWYELYWDPIFENQRSRALY